MKWVRGEGPNRMTDQQGSGVMGDAMPTSRAVLAHHGKSFNWAGRFLSAASLDRAARLYAFCRYLDDLADESEDLNEASRTLKAVRDDLARGETDRPDVVDFFDLCAGDSRALAGALLLTDTVRTDLVPMRVENADALLTYALGVAGSVGIMMCAILDAEDLDRALPFAIDLGIAMQLTNIARDVLEDAARGRIYLPPEWTDGPLPPDALVGKAPQIRERAWPGVLRVLSEADAYYESARAGLCFLPFRARTAIHVASHVYRGIGGVIRGGNAERYWQGRAFTTAARKVMLTTGALGGLAALPGRRQARHDRRLHKAINPTLRSYGFVPGPDGISMPESAELT